MRLGKKIFNKRIFFLVIAIVLFQLVVCVMDDIDDNRTKIEEGLHNFIILQSMKIGNPFMLYIDSDWNKRNIDERIWDYTWQAIPVRQYLCNSAIKRDAITQYHQNNKNNNVKDNTIKKNEEEAIKLEEAVIKENIETGKFMPVKSPVAKYSAEQLKQPGFIKETFYTEDPTTQLQPEQSDYDTLMGFDAKLIQDNSKPQILIYHTHSQEAYVNSDISDKATTIVGVGDHLCKILSEKYGYNVIHHKGEYDVESRDYAYSNAMIGVEKVLAENPSIEIIIDLHRDEVNADTKLVTTIQDIPMAKFMFFNGLSYTKELGKLDSLPNQYVQDNLSFSFQMQLASEEYYPGLTRRIYLKGYRYNLHYRPKSLLIELGAQTNTVEEAMNSCEPLAHIISLVINGENKIGNS